MAARKECLMIANELKNVYHQTKWALVVRGLLSLIVGILIIARPMSSVAALALGIDHGIRNHRHRGGSDRVSEPCGDARHLAGSHRCIRHHQWSVSAHGRRE